MFVVPGHSEPSAATAAPGATEGRPRGQRAAERTRLCAAEIQSARDPWGQETAPTSLKRLRGGGAAAARPHTPPVHGRGHSNGETELSQKSSHLKDASEFC